MPDANAISRTPRPRSRPGWKLRFEDRLGLLDPIQIIAFPSFGTPELLHVRGRVRERKNVSGTSRRSSFWRNITNTLRRVESDEIPGAVVRATFRETSLETSTDGEGYFVFDIEPDERLEGGWHDVELELLESVGDAECSTTRAAVLVPAADAEFGVISDVDDTIIRTHSNHLIRQLATILGRGARDCVMFPGVGALYRALARGPDDRGSNPIFYVSMSGWNLYDMLDEFMQEHDLRVGRSS